MTDDESAEVQDVPEDMSQAAGPVEVDLRGRSVRTLAWLGDAEFEREVRMQLAQRGDYPTDRLHAMTARVVCAEAQAELLAAIEAGLDEAELGVVRRARNLNGKGGSRGVRSVRDYRSATALEALVAHWCFGAPGGRARFEALISPWLATRIDAAIVAAGRALRRG
jgi:ribonuclease-3 family protein